MSSAATMWLRGRLSCSRRLGVPCSSRSPNRLGSPLASHIERQGGKPIELEPSVGAHIRPNIAQPDALEAGAPPVAGERRLRWQHVTDVLDALRLSTRIMSG